MSTTDLTARGRLAWREEYPNGSQIELAQRSSTGVDVTLLWLHDRDVDSALVLVHDQASGSYFEIPAEPYLALDIYYHPFAYRDFSTVDSEKSRVRSQATVEGMS